MKSLALYIDKSYIIGTVINDGYSRPVNLPNHEDRIWLYFYEDVVNDEISYGKGFQTRFRNNENHYYGDVFSLITRSAAKYIMFNRPQPMKGIFKSAKIFDDLRNDIEDDGIVSTYISFSKDISLAARLPFLEELKNEKFDVQESVARIGHLALEYTAKAKSYFAEDGFYLVFNACNENLHYSLYQKSGDLYVRINESVLVGLGTDVRSRALIEYVVDTINNKEHFLQTQDEREYEYLRMNQFVDDWLAELSTARNGIPYPLTNITFSRDTYKEYTVQVRKKRIDERTEKIVKDIISEITRFVKDSNVNHEQIKGILFLGSTFTNEQFKKELCGYYYLDNEKMICYKDSDLATLVSAYTFIDCEQFIGVKSKFRSDAEAEVLRIKIAEEEAAARKKAEEEARSEAASQKAATEAERKFKEAMDKGYDAERNHDYAEMEDYFSIAVGLRPNDDEAKNKHGEALRKKAEMIVQQNQYKEKIQQAKVAYDEQDYETAKQKSEEALGLMNDSKKAIQIKENSIRHLKCLKDYERYLDRIDLFIAQKAYVEAKQELEKAKLLDICDKELKELKERENKIVRAEQETTTQVKELTLNLNQALDGKRYDDALVYCNQLISIDSLNLQKWSSCLADIQTKQEKYKEEQKRFKSILAEIESAQWNENWEKLVSLCSKALEIRHDADIHIKLRKAEEKVKEENELKLIDSTIIEIKDLILTSDFKSARIKLTELRKKELNPLHESKIKELNRLIFEKEDVEEKVKRVQNQQKRNVDHHDNSETSRTRVTGFFRVEQKNNKPEKGLDDFDFFSTPAKQKEQKSPQESQSSSSKPNSRDDFFDSASSNEDDILAEKPHMGISNDDFNF